LRPALARKEKQVKEGQEERLLGTLAHGRLLSADVSADHIISLQAFLEQFFRTGFSTRLRRRG
jgi:hypothetical protein